MPRFSAHLGYMFTELPLERRFAAAAEAGFADVEHPAPFALPAARCRVLLAENGLSMVQISSGSGAAGQKGLAALPGHEQAFRDDLLRALDYAEEIGCPLLHPMAGIAVPDQNGAVWSENIAFAMEAAGNCPVAIFVEPISRAAVPGYFLHRLDQYLFLTAPMDPAPLVLVDSYHAAMNGEDAAAFIRANPSRIAHVHIADAPGRHEPGTGGYDFRPLDAALHDIGYRGVIGCEYLPAGETRAGLSWRVGWPQTGR
ncbi:MAG: TIM barrel protein [Paracoccus denitrificans]|uniref:TIM barrel protein n=1 Tax=Paracoccus denitrificans TaxID=266 RepID=A0A533I1R9_PARDE|nr:MAG: TIM barrel protein [Paracoccus denitrificans]